MLETGFLGIFMTGTFSDWNIINPFYKRVRKFCDPPFVSIYLNRWLIFRIMLGAGLIKLRGDQCWRDLTCLDYHYETQPIPNPLSYYLHVYMPHEFHAAGILYNHFVEIICCFLALIPIRFFRQFAGINFVLFQFILILSGNLSFLNWLTILPALCCFDDRFYTNIFRNWKISKIQEEVNNKYKSSRTLLKSIKNKTFNLYFQCGLLVLIITLSTAPTLNLMSSDQIMNYSFDNFRIVNTYGAFGSIGKTRNEVILLGTNDKNVNINTEWHEYEFPCKPGRVDRIPCIITPYHYRCDWQIWFSSFQQPNHQSWLVHLMAQLLEGNTQAEQLLSYNPFNGTTAPSFIKADYYHYEFYDPLNKDHNKNPDKDYSKNWYSRTYRGSYIQPMNLNDVSDYIKTNFQRMVKK